MLLVQLHHCLLQLLPILLVFFLDCLHLGLDGLHCHARTHRLLVERPQDHPHCDSKEDEHPPILEAKGLVHPQEDAHDKVRKRLDDGTEDPTVGVHVFQGMSNIREAAEFLGPEVHLVSEPPIRCQQRDQNIGARCVLAAPQPTRSHSSPDSWTAVLDGQDRADEVPRLESNPLERAI